MLANNEICKTLENLLNEIAKQPATARMKYAFEFEPFRYEDGSRFPVCSNQGLMHLKDTMAIHEITPLNSLELLTNETIISHFSKIFLPCVKTAEKYAKIVFEDLNLNVINGSAWQFKLIHDMYVAEAKISAFIFGKLGSGWADLMGKSLDLHLLLLKDLGVPFHLRIVKFSETITLNTVPTASLSSLFLRKVFGNQGDDFKIVSSLLEKILNFKTIDSLKQFETFTKLSTEFTEEFLKTICLVLGPKKGKQLPKPEKLSFDGWFCSLKEGKVCAPFLQTCMKTLEEAFKLKQDNSHHQCLKFTDLLKTQWQLQVNLRKCHRLVIQDKSIELLP